MSKKTPVIALVIVVIIVSGAAYLLSNKGSRQANEATSGTNQQAAPSANSAEGALTGSYIDYTEGALASAAGTKLLFFHAQWCPQCRAIDADIKRDGVPEGVTIIKVDYDTNQTLRKKYGVTLQTTIVKVNGNGQLVEKFVAYDDPSLDAITKRLLLQ